MNIPFRADDAPEERSVALMSNKTFPVLDTDSTCPRLVVDAP